MDTSQWDRGMKTAFLSHSISREPRDSEHVPTPPSLEADLVRNWERNGRVADRGTSARLPECRRQDQTGEPCRGFAPTRVVPRGWILGLSPGQANHVDNRGAPQRMPHDSALVWESGRPKSQGRGLRGPLSDRSAMRGLAASPQMSRGGLYGKSSAKWRRGTRLETRRLSCDGTLGGACKRRSSTKANPCRAKSKYL